MSRGINLKYHYKLNYRKNYNILAKDYKVIYFNTQKNANTTMKTQFVDVLELPKTKHFPEDIHYNYDFPTATQNEITSSYDDFLKFSILRNPWERLVSCYLNKIKQSSRTGDDYILECSPDLYIGMSFKDFVEVVCDLPDSESDYHFCSQSYLMLYPDGYFPINYFCNIENLKEHIEEIKLLTGIPFSRLSNSNSSKNYSYKRYYTSELIEKVRHRYHIDIAFFKYEFGKQNTKFSFGKVTADWESNIANHPFMISILKEKNRELIKELAYKNSPLIRDINQLTQDIERLKKEQQDIKNSSSWKITTPLRIFGKHWLK